MLANDAAPALLIEAVAVPLAGNDNESNLPIFACTLPVDAAERSNIPFVVSIPKTLTYPFIQFWSVRKLEFMVTLDPEIESDPKISLMFTVAIFFLFVF